MLNIFKVRVSISCRQVVELCIVSRHVYSLVRTCISCACVYVYVRERESLGGGRMSVKCFGRRRKRTNLSMKHCAWFVLKVVANSAAIAGQTLTWPVTTNIHSLASL